MSATYSAVTLTVLTVAVLLALAALYAVTKPKVAMRGVHEDDTPGLITDPEDTGVRVTTLHVVSPLPLTWVDARYRVVLPDARLDLMDAPHAVAVESLRRAGVDDATWSLTFTTQGAVLPREPWEVFELALPLVRRLTALEATVRLRDPLGRTVTKIVPALPKQQLGRPVTAAERAAGRGARVTTGRQPLPRD